MPINFEEAKKKLKKKETNLFDKSLTQLLKEDYSGLKIEKDTKFKLYKNFDYIGNKFKKQVIEDLTIRRNIDKEKLFWAIYIENLLKKLATNLQILHNWYLITYLEKYEETKNPYFLQQAGDVALIKSSFLPGKLKMIRKKDYIRLEKNMYYNWYLHTENMFGEILAKNLEFYAND